MIFKVRKQIFITYSPGTQYYISNGKDRYLTKDGVISKSAINGWWHSKVEAEIFLTGWKVLNPLPAPKLYQIDFEPQHEQGEAMSFEIVKINVFRIKATEFKANSWSFNGDYAIYVKYPGNNTLFLWKDGTIHHNSTGWAEVGSPEEFSLAAGYWKTKREAKIFLAGWLSLSAPSTVMIIKHRQTEVLTIGEASWYQTYGPHS